MAKVFTAPDISLRWRLGMNMYQPPKMSVLGSVFGVNFVVLDEKGSGMATFNQVFDLFKQWNNKQEGIGRIIVYGDGSGHVEDGNDEEVMSWSDLDEAVEALNEELAAVAEWQVDSCELGCCWFLVNKQQGLRYPISGGEGEGQAIARQLAKLANRDFGDDYYIPVGSKVNFENDGGWEYDAGVYEGTITAIDLDDDEYPYQIAFAADDETHIRWGTFAQVKVHPQDHVMRMKLIDLARAYAININTMGLLNS